MRSSLRVSAIAMVLAIALAPIAAGASPDAPVLVDQAGHRFTLDTLHGQRIAVTFVAAHCTDACPLIDGQFAQAAALLKQRKSRVRLLTITLDPEHDSPAVMRDLARRFHADPRVWIFASGNSGDVHAVMQRFGVVAQRGRGGYADVHTTFVYLLDERGRTARTMLASFDLAHQLVSEVASLWPASTR